MCTQRFSGQGWPAKYVNLIFSFITELYTLPLAWQNKDYTVTTVSNGSSEATTGNFQSVSFTSSTAVWEERNGLSSWRCHYTDEHIVVFKRYKDRPTYLIEYISGHASVTLLSVPSGMSPPLPHFESIPWIQIQWLIPYHFENIENISPRKITNRIHSCLYRNGIVQKYNWFSSLHSLSLLNNHNCHFLDVSRGIRVKLGPQYLLLVVTCD